MQVCDCELKSLSKSLGFASEQIVFVESNTTNIFHCAEIMFWNENLVIFSERVGNTEKFFVESHPTLGNCEHFFVINRLHQGFAGVNSHWGHSRRVSFKKVERPSYYGKKVSRKAV